MFGCLKNLGCLVLLLIAAGAAWLYRDRWLPLVPHVFPAHHASVGARASQPRSSGGATAAPSPWEPLTPEGGARARAAVARLGTRMGPVFADVAPADLSAYLFQELSHQLPPSAQHVEAAVLHGELAVRASIAMRDLGAARKLGPLGAVLGERANVELDGTLDIVRPGLAEYRVRALRVGRLGVPSAMIPRLVRELERGRRPSGLASDALPLVAPREIADVRIRPKTITLYKAVP